MFSNKYVRVLVVTLFAAMLLGALPVAAQDPVVVQWFVGLGTGAQPNQVEVENVIVEEFNASHDDIQLEMIVVDNNVAIDTLSTLIASGQAPDLVGPVGVGGSNSFAGQYLDLQPLVDASGYDLTQFPEAAVEFYRSESEGLIGLPFGAYPKALIYNVDLFDEAGLPYPPQEWGAPYTTWEGTEVTWDMDALRDLAMLLTLDANGNDATSPDFDPENVVQWGFMNQWTAWRGMATMFGAAAPVDDEGNAVIPESWTAAAHWYEDAIWVDHFYPNADQQGSDLLAAGNPFVSGNLAMNGIHLWYASTAGTNVNWDVAALPSYNGVITANLHADTFRVLNSTDSPAETFEVLAYLTGEGSVDLLAAYGAMPSRLSDQDPFFETLGAQVPETTDLRVFVGGLDYPDIPNHESNLPNHVQSTTRIDALQTLIYSTPDLDVDAELETLRLDLQAIFDAASE